MIPFIYVLRIRIRREPCPLLGLLDSEIIKIKRSFIALKQDFKIPLVPPLISRDCGVYPPFPLIQSLQAIICVLQFKAEITQHVAALG